MQPFRLWRKIQKGEFIIVGGDCSQGGPDSNTSAFLSKDKRDFPITYKRQGVANDMTDDIFPVLEWIHDVTGIKPVVAFERSNGGASEMDRLNKLNLKKKYVIYQMKHFGKEEDPSNPNKNISKELGWTTSTLTRPILVKDWRNAIDNKLIRLYDEEFIEEHKTFVINSKGKPEAAKGFHDDCVISPAISWQLYQTEEPQHSDTDLELMTDEIPDNELFTEDGFY